MPDLTEDLRRHVNLRRRAALRVGGAHGGGALGLSASAALGVLHRLASSPATATEALSLLHELQVHQVELELQDEELRASRAELETLVNRHRQLYDGSPAGSFAIDQATVITELNLAGVRLLGSTRAAAIGRRFDSLVADDDKRVLRALLKGADQRRGRHPHPDPPDRERRSGRPGLHSRVIDSGRRARDVNSPPRAAPAEVRHQAPRITARTASWYFAHRPP